MGQVKAPDVPRPKRRLTDFERKIAEILFAETYTNELQVERVLDVAIVISDGLMKDALDGICISNGAECGASIESSAGMLFLQHNTLDVGDKVKIIIVRDD